MADEPDEPGDSGSDAAGASSSSDSAEPNGADDGGSSPTGPEDAGAGDETVESAESDGSADGDDADGSADKPADRDSADEPTDESTDAEERPDESASDDDADGEAPDDGAADGAADPDDGPSTAPDMPRTPGTLPFAGEDQPESSDDAADPGEEGDDEDGGETDDAGGDDNDGGGDGDTDGDDEEDGDGDDDADDDGDGDVSDLEPIGFDSPAPEEGEAAAASTTDDAAATATDTGGSSGSSILSGGIGGSAPPDDEEMPLTEHIEEMLTRLAIVVVVAAFATLAVFPFANDLIINMWYDVHTGSVDACRAAPQSDDCVAPHVYGPLELVLTRIRVAGLAGLLVALPLGVYQTYRFMRPGLYPHERRYFLASVPFSLVLGIVGMAFAYLVVLPLLFAYFIGYTEGSADLAFQLAETMNLILLMMGMLAVIFQIPLLIMLAIMMGITTRQWLERRRLYFWGLFLGVAVIFGPDPTGMAPFLLTATMVALFEGTLLLLRWTGR